MTRAELYIAWNNALVDFFITTSTSTVFYVTESKLEDIGKHYDIEKDEDEQYLDCFINAISFFVEKRSDIGRNSRGRISYDKLNGPTGLFSNLFIKRYRSPEGECSKRYLLQHEFGNNNATLLGFAVFLTKHEIFLDMQLQKELQYPYFPYVIFVLLGFNSSTDREWSGVEVYFKARGIHFCANDRQNVASLFEHLIRNNILTPSCVQTQDSYIKYLKYHSVLTPTDKGIFDQILYDHHIRWNKNMVYGELRDLIWRVGIRNIQQHAKLREALLDPATRPYFESLIKNFDREEYVSQECDGQNLPTVKGSFRFVYDLLTHSSQIWLQYLKPECAVSNNGITLTSIRVYTDNFRVDIDSVVPWADYTNKGLTYKDSSYSVTSNKSDLYYFEIIEGRLLAEAIEPEQLVGKQCCLIVKSNKQDKQDLIQYHTVQQIDIQQLPVFGNDWEAYYVPQFIPKRAEEDMSTNQDIQQFKYAQLCFDNCITFDRKQYLLEAFPYIITEGVDPLKDVNITVADINGTDVSFGKKVVGNRIYLLDFSDVDSGEIMLTIKVGDNEEKHSYRVISNSQVTPIIDKKCAKFNKWGCLDEEIQDDYYSDNEIISSNSSLNNIISRYTPGYNKEKKESYHRLMSILYLLGNNPKRNSTFSSTDLDNVINYLASFEGDVLTEQEINSLKYALRDLGILTHYYKNGKYIYEANTPRLVPLKEGRCIYDGETVTEKRGLFLLYGTYSFAMYNELYDAVDHFEYKPLHLSDKLNKYLPPYIIVALQQGQNIADIKISKSSLFDDLMEFSGKISDFEKNFLPYTPTDPYPQMVPSNHRYGRSEVLRWSDNGVLNNDELSPDLLHTYISYKHNELSWYVENQLLGRKRLYFISKSKFESNSNLKLPFFIRKALVAKNYALPEYLYAFGMYGILGTDCLFNKMYMYEYDSIDNLQAVLGGVEPINLVFQSHSPELKMYLKKPNESELGNWQLALFFYDNLLCYTSQQDKVFYSHNGTFVEITSSKDGGTTVNSKMSAVLDLHISCISSRFDVNDWMAYYIKINKNITDIPSNFEKKFEVKIFNKL